VWWISYRGEGTTGVDNIGVFEDDGTPRKKHPLLLDRSTGAHTLHIARGFALVGADLYIANAWRKDSHVARYRRRGDTFHFADVVVATRHVSAMVHPFDVAIGGDSAPLNVPSPQGLKVVLDQHGKPRHSVRGIIVHRKHLYVADEAGDAVKIFAVKSGELVARIKGRKLTKPVHLILRGDTLYIGAAGTGSILALDIAAEPPRGKLKARTIIDGTLDAPSGFAIGPDGDLYVAERLKQRVRRFVHRSPPGHARVPGARTGPGVGPRVAALLIVGARAADYSAALPPVGSATCGTTANR